MEATLRSTANGVVAQCHKVIWREKNLGNDAYLVMACDVTFSATPTTLGN